MTDAVSTTMLDIEQVPALSPLAVEQVRVVIGFLQQQAAGPNGCTRLN